MPVHEQHTDISTARKVNSAGQENSRKRSDSTHAEPAQTSSAGFGGGLATWLKRVGLVGFLFFFIKGLVWLGIFFWAGTCAFQG